MLVLKIEKMILRMCCVCLMMFLPILHLWEAISLLRSFQIAFRRNLQKLNLFLVMKMQRRLEMLAHRYKSEMSLQSLCIPY